jgi:type IV pilus assembly protein PilW
MNTRRMLDSMNRSGRQRGYSLIEVAVAMAVALFLLGGMFTVLQSTRSNSGNQNLLAQLQEQERVAMTMMTDVIQQTGYYPNAQTKAPSDVLLPSAAFLTAGQSVVGGKNAYADTVTLRYEGDSTNSVLDCRGSVIPDGTIEEMQFQIKPLNANANAPKTLFCTVNGNDVPLVPNVTSLAITYGVDSSGSGSANAYLPANQMAPYWANVYSVKLNIGFANPLFGQPGQTIQTLFFNRVVGIMANSGVNVLLFQ